MKVKFSDVVRRANTKEDKDNTDKVFYVGGEHIDSNEVLITKRGIIAGSTIGPMFYFGFKAGQVLFVSRNPHLRKAGMVDFDGICSEKTFVLETIDENILLQRYLPFILQSDHFWSYAESNKSGSVNFFINWSTLAKYEFELPSIAKQKELSDLLWAINDTKLAYRKMLIATDELVKSQFIALSERFRESPTRMGDIASYINGAAFKPSDWSACGKPIIRIQNLNDPDAPFNHFAGSIDPKYLVNNGDILISWATHLEAYEWNGNDAWLNQHIFKVVFDKIDVDKTFFLYAANVVLRDALKKAHGFKATMEHIKRGDFEDAIVFLPEISFQRQFAYLAQQSDKSKLLACYANTINHIVIQKCLSKCFCSYS